jgi:hypothetical protein
MQSIPTETRMPITSKPAEQSHTFVQMQLLKEHPLLFQVAFHCS